ncbi:glycosyltransferase [uncultured Marinobacter sp.]|uniref:glycosyltransferase n=1 Tax=uncultured Marinobacter sp. TaxID=187379 RepID=UPI002599EE78|nr:glycosyltransferase [uncultured Marinobacter sp.]
MTMVSVVTPTFNRGRFLPEAVASVLAQTHTDLELIIVDDGSVDDTRKVLEPYLADRRVRYFYQENRGQSHARNLALEHAEGDVIAFLDSDDLWAPDKLEKQLAVLRVKPEVDIVHGDEAMIDEQGAVVSFENMRRYSGRITRRLLADNSVSITTALVRRRCFDEMGGFDTSVGVADDYELWLRFSARYCFHYEPGIVASYRVMADQISSDKRRRFAANERIIREFLARYGEVLSSYGDFWCMEAG